MKAFEDALKELVFEYTAVPSTSGAKEMASFCKELEEGWKRSMRLPVVLAMLTLIRVASARLWRS